MQNSPSDVVQFFDWFSKWSNQSINRQGNPEYPLWLTELTKLSKPMRKPSYAEGPLAKAAIIVYDLIKDISYCGTEEHHVEKTLDILQLLKSVPDGTEQKTR